MAGQEIISSVIYLDPYYHQQGLFGARHILKLNHVVVTELEESTENTLARIYPGIDRSLHKTKATKLVRLLQFETLYTGKDLVEFRVHAPVEQRIALYSGAIHFRLWQECRLDETRRTYLNNIP